MTHTEPVTGAEFLARSLAANGTTHVFFIDAVLRRTLIELGTLGVQRVLGHSEKAVAYMADGYARIAGRPGVCFAQSVGAANLASGLQDAYLGRAPVIAMTGHKPPSMQHRNAYQEIPHAPLFSPVTKFSARVDQAADLPRLMRQAWREAMTGTPRPAHLDLNGLQAEVIETGMVAESPVAEPAFQLTMPPHRPSPSATEIERAADRILRAKKVVIVAGEGATASAAGKELLALGELLAAPIATSLGGRGIDPDAASPVDWLRRQLCRAAGEPDRARGRPGGVRRLRHRRSGHPHLAHSGDRYAVRADRYRSARDRPVLSEYAWRDGRSEGDAGRVDHRFGPSGARHRVRRPGRRHHVGVADSRATALASNAMPIWPDRLCAEITRALPADGILVADTGYSEHLEQFVDRTERRRTDLSARGRIARLVVPGGARREMRGAESQGDLLVGRRRDLLPSDRTGDRAAARHRRRAGGQQQLGLRPGLAEHPAPARQQAGRRRRTGALRADEFRRCGAGVRPARHSRGGSVADRAGVAGRTGVGRDRRRRCRNGYRLPGA